MKFKITKFGERHFDRKFGGTKILDMTKEEVEKHINKLGVCMDKTNKPGDVMTSKRSNEFIGVKVHDGYAPFCRLVAVRNFTDAKVGSMPITLENYQYIRSGYSARRESELPVFSRWLDLPLGKPVAEWLVFVLYDKEQINKEAKTTYDKDMEYYLNENHKQPLDRSEKYWKMEENPPSFKEFDADWGVVAILGQSHSNEEPMKPETMLRNALGIDEGGSGVKLDRNAYISSCEFWDKHATVK